MFRRIGVTALSTVLGSAVALHSTSYQHHAYAADILAMAAQSQTSLNLRVSKRLNSQTAGDPNGLAFQVTGASAFSILEIKKDGASVDASALGIDFQSSGYFFWQHQANHTGSYVLTIGGTKDGVSDSINVSFKLKPVTFAPTLKAAKSSAVNGGDKVSVELKGQDKDGDALVYSIVLDGSDALPEGAGVSSVAAKAGKKSAPAFVWQTKAGDAKGGENGKGIYRFTASVSDGTSTTSKALTVKVRPAKEAKNKAPKFEKLAHQLSYFVGETIEFDVNATDDGLPYGSALTYSLGNAPEGATIEGSHITCPADKAGELSFEIKVSDSKLSGRMFVKVLVNEMPNDNHAPELLGIDGEGVEGKSPYRIKMVAGESVNFQVVAEDEDAESLEYSVTTTRGAIPEGSSISEDGNFSWDIANAGVYNLIVRVKDGAGATDSARVIVRASRPGTTPAPVKPNLRVGSHSGGKYYIDEAVEFTARVTNAVEGENYEFNLSGAPGCALLVKTDDVSATFSSDAECLTGGNVGSTQFAISVSDSRGLSDSEDVALVFELRPNGGSSEQPNEKPEVNHAPVFKALQKPMRSTVYYSVAEINQLKAQGKQISFQHSEARDDHDTPEMLSYAVSSETPLPTGAAYDAATRTYSWLPPATPATFAMKFVVADSAGKTDTMTYKIVVRAK